MSVALSRAARSAGLLLAVLSVVVFPAASVGAGASSAPLTQCPCNIGLPPAANSAAPTTSSRRTNTDAPPAATADGFDYVDAALGATAAAGTALLVLALTTATRRQRLDAGVR